MTYPEVRRQVEAILLAMVAEGRAEMWGVGRWGPIYTASMEDVMDRAELAGLVDAQPFSVAFALARLHTEAAR